MSYRDTLYTNYASHFGAGKPEKALEAYAPMFEQTYRLDRLPPKAEIADLGCGRGEWLRWMRSKGDWALTGIDWSEADLQCASDIPHVTLLAGSAVEQLKSMPAAFDLLHGKDVIEHMTKDEIVEFLTVCLQSLKPGGQLWLSTFNAQAPFAEATRYGDFTHEIGVTPSSMMQVLRACRFGEISIRGCHAVPPTLKGRIRKFVWRLCEPFWKLVLKARHGGGAERPGIDVLCVAPDLLVIASKPL